jgi:hypothetical protein
MRRLLLALLLVVTATSIAGAQAVIFQRTSGSITTAGADCSVATRCVVLRDATRTGTGTVQIFGTFTGTLQFEGTLDDTLAETSWFALSVNPNGAVSFVASGRSRWRSSPCACAPPRWPSRPSACVCS